MDFGASSRHARRAGRVAALFGTVSFLTVAGIAAAQAQEVEEVLVTGSLVRGAPAVGLPVTTLGAEDFKQSGSLTVAELMRTLGSMRVQEVSPTSGGGRISFAQNVEIHSFSPGSGPETLMLINGMRFPVQGHGGDSVDPSIISQISLSRVDVLSAGASSTYGSDAVAGVINLILKRGFDGAVTELAYSSSTDIGNTSLRGSQLYGRSWDGGNVTVSFEFSDREWTPASARPYFTLNFEPYGLDDRTPIGSNVPAVISLGAPAFPSTGVPFGFLDPAVGTRFCANCFSVPKGVGWNYGDTPAHTNPTAPGSAPTTTWSAILANPGVKNQRNPWYEGGADPAIRRHFATITFDEQIIPGVSLFVDGFYHHRLAKMRYPSTNAATLTGSSGLVVPTTNPYRPVGAPTNLNVNYSFALDVPLYQTGGEIASRYAFGFDLDMLPFDWAGRVFYSMTEDHNFALTTGAINTSAVSAAVGQTVTVAANTLFPGSGASTITKPANIPFLNVFCDSTVFRCNSQTTLDYITGSRLEDERWKVKEAGFNFDGPIYELPGGTLKGAVGGNIVQNHYLSVTTRNDTTISTAIPSVVRGPASSGTWAIFGQLDVPVVGEANHVPLIESLDIEAAYRYDHYEDPINGVKTPKIGFNWRVGLGLMFRGTWGKVFRGPAPSETSPFISSSDDPINTAAGAASQTVRLRCNAVNGIPNSVGVAQPGSLTALLNPKCSTDSALQNPGGILARGGAGSADPLVGAIIAASTGRSDLGSTGDNLALLPSALVSGKDILAVRRTGLSPEHGKQWILGFNFAPKEPVFGVDLTGINIDASLFDISMDGLITGAGLATIGTSSNPDDPASRIFYIVRPCPLIPITSSATCASGASNVEFLKLVQGLIAQPGNTFNPANIEAVQFIQDSANINAGNVELRGIDFDARYDWDWGSWGSWNVGANGYYEINFRTKVLPFLERVVETYKGQDSGSRLKRVRGQLGWTDGTLSVTGFVNYRGHSETEAIFVPPDCYWKTGFSAGSCYAGSPYVGPFDRFPNYSPSTYFFDLSIGYQLGDTPANPYLRNIGLQLTVNDIFNRAPPFRYGTRGTGRTQGRDIAAFDRNYSDQQRTVTFIITKNW